MGKRKQKKPQKQQLKDLIREFREALGMTQAEFRAYITPPGKKLISQPLISKYESGAGEPMPDVLRMLYQRAREKGFKLTAEQLLNIDPDIAS